ncbi:signal peptide protein, YSIRK family [Lentilactobacillus raoultii]|uniref:Signal peptide protein, YSIRK family n=1 Tax=Lentilactobacillus raoultii TaxID=1987503 RepID=A0ABW3PHY7_9LACO|nr:signal peptide protein, YSIRK family [Lentilactobacillus raoultii]
MKILLILLAGFVLTFPFLTAASTANAATKPKTYSFSILTADFYDHPVAYHTSSHQVTLYRASIGADTPTISFTAKGKLKAKATYRITRYVKAKSNVTQKNRVFLYVKGHGWVQRTKLIKGPLSTDH